jgi:hypothetical protein
MEAYREVEVQLHKFLTAALDGIVFCSCFSRFNMREAPSISTDMEIEILYWNMININSTLVIYGKLW